MASSSSSAGSGSAISWASSDVITRTNCLAFSGNSSAGTNSSSAGTQCTDDSYEPNDVAALAKPVTLSGALTTLSLNSCPGATGASYTDWFRIPVPAGNGLRVTLSSNVVSADLDMYLSYASAPDVTVASAFRDTSTGWTPTNEIAQLTYLQNATDVLVRVHNVGINSGESQGPIPTAYTMSIQLFSGGGCLADEYEENDTQSAAASYPDTVYHLPLTACPSDVDFYSVTAERAAFAQVRVKYQGAITTAIRDPATGAVLVNGTNANGYSTLDFDSTRNKSYWLQVGAASGNSIGSDYDILLNTGFCDPNNDADDSLAAADRFYGDPPEQDDICETDLDYKYFITPNSGPVTLSMDWSDTAYGKLSAIVFTTSESSPVATFALDSSSGQGEVTFDATANTTYNIKVSNPAGIGPSSYSMSMSGFAICEDSMDEPNDTLGTATYISNGATPVEKLCGNTDPDHFIFSLAQGGTGTRVVVTHSAGANLNLTLTDEAGTPITLSQSVEPDSIVLTFDAQPNFNYVVKVENADATEVVTYWIDVLPAPLSMDTCAGAVELSASQSLSVDTTGAADDINSVPTGCTRYRQARGRDLFFALTVAPGQIAAIEAVPVSGDYDVVLYLVDGCDTRCCWAGMDEGNPGDTETLVYRNSTSSTQRLYLGVDGYSVEDFGSLGLTVNIQ